MPDSTTAHIRLDDRGVAWIDDTNTKVVEVALDMIAHGWSPEEIHFQHRHLSLAQIHAALGYYYDHKAEIDTQIQRNVKDVQNLRAQAGESPIRKRLRETGALRCAWASTGDVHVPAAITRGQRQRSGR